MACTCKTMKEKYTLIEDKIGKGWWNLLKPVFHSHWPTIVETIRLEKKTITPVLDKVLRAFETCKLEDLKVLILDYEPYTGIINNKQLADGLCISSENSAGTPPKKLKLFMEQLANYEGTTAWNDNTDLSYLAEQGVFLLNANLTTTINESGAHKKVWEPFMMDLLTTICNTQSGLPVIFIGEKTREYAKVCNPLITNHFYTQDINDKQEFWECDDLFEQINVLLKEQNQTEIKWVPD